MKSYVRKKRHELRLTQAECSSRSGISIKTIRRYEQGKLCDSVRYIYILAKILNCKCEDLLELTEDDFSNNTTIL